MNCKKVQDLLWTDYIDGQLDVKWKTEVDKHLVNCSSCREFAQLAKQTAVEPFLKIEDIQPPPQIWTKIKEQIQGEERLSSNPVVDFLEQLKHVLAIPRSALAFALALMMVVMVGSFTRFNVQPKTDTTEQIEYLSSLFEAPNDSLIGETGGFGTTVEQYFL